MIEEYHNSPLLPPYVEDSRHNGPIWSRPQLKQRQTYCEKYTKKARKGGYNIAWIATHIANKVAKERRKDTVVWVKLSPHIYDAMRDSFAFHDDRLDWDHIISADVGKHRIMLVYSVRK